MIATHQLELKLALFVHPAFDLDIMKISALLFPNFEVGNIGARSLDYGKFESVWLELPAMDFTLPNLQVQNSCVIGFPS